MGHVGAFGSYNLWYWAVDRSPYPERSYWSRSGIGTNVSFSVGLFVAVVEEADAVGLSVLLMLRAARSSLIGLMSPKMRARVRLYSASRSSMDFVEVGVFFGAVSSVVSVEAGAVEEEAVAAVLALVRSAFSTGLAGDTRFIILIFCAGAGSGVGAVASSSDCNIGVCSDALVLHNMTMLRSYMSREWASRNASATLCASSRWNVVDVCTCISCSIASENSAFTSILSLARNMRFVCTCVASLSKDSSVWGGRSSSPPSMITLHYRQR